MTPTKIRPTIGKKELSTTSDTILYSGHLKICFVTDLLSDSIETFPSSSLLTMEWLANAGYSVSVLSLHSHEDRAKSLLNWQDKDGKNSIHFIPFIYHGPPISSLSPAVHSYHILHWMLEKASEFDIIHFPITNGLAYYTLLAKHQGWAFQKIKFCIDIQAPKMWHKQMHKQWIEQVDDLAADFLERESVRLADIILSQNHDVFHWMKQQNWQLPKHVHLLPKSQLALSKEEIKRAWLSLHEKIRKEKLNEQSSFTSFSIQKEDDKPLVSVCLTHFNRPHYLAQALESIRKQDYPNFEVILVDDASSLPEAQAYLNHLTEEFESKGWQIIRNQTNLFPGAARNLAARQSRGEYLLFMDDDNYAKPDEISTFIQVAKKVNADMLTCAMDVFEGHLAPSQQTPLIHRFLPLGAAAGVGLYFNLFGDINALIKKKVYEALNGLTEDYGMGGEDWEFFSRAVLKGYHLETIPLALFWYRDTPSSITKTTHLYANSLRGIRSYLDVVPPALHGNLILSQAQQEKLTKLLIEHNQIGKMLRQCWRLFSSRARRAICHPRQSVKKIIKHLFKV